MKHLNLSPHSNNKIILLLQTYCSLMLYFLSAVTFSPILVWPNYSSKSNCCFCHFFVLHPQASPSRTKLILLCCGKVPEIDLRFLLITRGTKNLTNTLISWSGASSGSLAGEPSTGESAGWRQHTCAIRLWPSRISFLSRRARERERERQQQQKPAVQGHNRKFQDVSQRWIDPIRAASPPRLTLDITHRK